MKGITIADIPGFLPPDHLDLLSHRIVTASIGAKARGIPVRTWGVKRMNQSQKTKK